MKSVTLGAKKQKKNENKKQASKSAKSSAQEKNRLRNLKLANQLREEELRKIFGAKRKEIHRKPPKVVLSDGVVMAENTPVCEESDVEVTPELMEMARKANDERLTVCQDLLADMECF